MHASHATRRLLRIFIPSFLLICIFDDGTASIVPIIPVTSAPTISARVRFFLFTKGLVRDRGKGGSLRRCSSRLDRLSRGGDKKQQEPARVHQGEQAYAGVIRRFCRDILLSVLTDGILIDRYETSGPVSPRARKILIGRSRY